MATSQETRKRWAFDALLKNFDVDGVGMLTPAAGADQARLTPVLARAREFDLVSDDFTRLSGAGVTFAFKYAGRDLPCL